MSRPWPLEVRPSCPRWRLVCRWSSITAVVLLLTGAYAHAEGPAVATDQADYAPGQTAVITGTGWSPGEVVTLVVRHIDGEAEGGNGHEPWTVSATEDGSFETTWYVDPDDSLGSTFLLTATGASGATAQATFTDNIGLNLDQCQNGTLANLNTACGTQPTQWANGNINGQNSQYREGDGLPYRNFVSGIPNGTWVIRIQYDFTKGGIYAIDRLTRYNLTQNSNPCLGTAAGFSCGGDPTFEFEMPGEVATPTATAPALPNGGALDVAGSVANLDADGRKMAVWVQGGTAAFLSAGQNAPLFNDDRVLQSGSAAGDSSREFAFKVTLSGCPTTGRDAGCSLMMGWTGHIAAARDWGHGKGASSVTGAPFHMRIIGVDQVNGTSGGNQDRSVQLDAILDAGTIVIVKDAQPNTAQDFSFSGTFASFSLDDDDDPTLSNTATFSDVEAGSHTVEELAASGGYSLTGLTCTVTAGAITSPNVPTRTVTINLAPGATVTCTFTNSFVDPCLSTSCDDGNVCTDDVCDGSSGVAVCGHTNNTVSCDDGAFCTTGDQCSDGECRPGGASACGDGQVCDEADDQCVQCLTDAQCGGQVCDTESNTCVQCLTDAQCGGDTPICNSETNTCEGCDSDTECSAGTVCHSTGACTECNSDAQCGGTTPVCNASGTCEGCDNNDDCIGLGVCDESGSGMCVQCNGPAECGGNTPVCNMDTNTCERCTNDFECTQGTFCDAADSGACVECVTSAQCGGNTPVCNDTTNTCVPCTEDSECAAGSVCADNQSGMCVQCNDNNDCGGDTPFCNTGTHQCGECITDAECVLETAPICVQGADGGVCTGCTDSDQCGGTQYCADSGDCVDCLEDSQCGTDAPVCGAQGECVECDVDHACAEGQVCDTENGYRCVECLGDSDCDGSRPYCDTESNTCIECVADADCNDDNACTAESCGEGGQCERANVECAVVTSSALCQFDEFADGCEGTQGREFRLVYTPDVQAWPAYKLSSSNPGQTYYNTIVENAGASVRISVPYPYVTVGAMPVHVYCGDDLTFDANGCFVPPAAVAAHPLLITMDDWRQGGRCAASAPADGVTTYPAGAGSCDIEVPLPADLCGGKFYVNAHLDYGLKGGGTDGVDADAAADRYDIGAADGVGFDAMVNVDAGDATVVAVNQCTPYTFSDTGSEKSDTVFSSNVFKRIAGVFGQTTNRATGQAITGVTATLTAKSARSIVAVAASDADGYVVLNYKHTGKPATFTVTLDIPGVGRVSRDVTLRANGWAETSYDVATGAWYVVSVGDK